MASLPKLAWVGRLRGTFVAYFANAALPPVLAI